jgi:hypothetical protein
VSPERAAPFVAVEEEDVALLYSLICKASEAPGDRLGRHPLFSAGWHDCEMVQVSSAPVVSTEDCSEKLTGSRNGNGTHTRITSQERIDPFFGIGFG